MNEIQIYLLSFGLILIVITIILAKSKYIKPDSETTKKRALWISLIIIYISLLIRFVLDFFRD